MTQTFNESSQYIQSLTQEEWERYTRDAIEDAVGNLTLSSKLRGIDTSLIIPIILNEVGICLTTYEIEEILRRSGISSQKIQQYITLAEKSQYVKQIDILGEDPLWTLSSNFNLEA